MNEPVRASAKADRLVILGQIAGAFGVEGWVKVVPFTDPPENLLSYPVWQSERRGERLYLKLQDGRVVAKGVLAKFEGIDSPEQARELGRLEVGVPREELPPTEPGEYYWTDLEGAQAFSPAGELLGTVDHFEDLPAHPVVVIRGEREHWIPFVAERVLDVDVAAGRIVLDWAPDW